MSGGGCKTCPVKGCDAQYRGSQCAALRAKAGVDSDPLTNADRIRAMSDEELAREINRMFKCDTAWQEKFLAWLQQPATEEGEQNV